MSDKRFFQALAARSGTEAVNAAVTEMIDTGNKNIIPSGQESGTGTRYKDITGSFPAGEYVIYFSSITSNDTDHTQCQVGAFAGTSTPVSNQPKCDRGNGKYTTLKLTSDADFIRVYASDTHAHGANDTITFSNAMLCKKVYFDVSKKYIAPSA